MSFWRPLAIVVLLTGAATTALTYVVRSIAPENPAGVNRKDKTSQSMLTWTCQRDLRALTGNEEEIEKSQIFKIDVRYQKSPFDLREYISKALQKMESFEPSQNIVSQRMSGVINCTSRDRVEKLSFQLNKDLITGHTSLTYTMNGRTEEIYTRTSDFHNALVARHILPS